MDTWFHMHTSHLSIYSICLSVYFVIILHSSDIVSSGPFHSVRRLGEKNMSSDEDVAAASRHTHFIGKKDNIIQARRVVKSVGERDVLVIYHQGDFYAIDVRCYRKLRTGWLKGIVHPKIKMLSLFVIILFTHSNSM